MLEVEDNDVQEFRSLQDDQSQIQHILLEADDKIVTEEILNKYIPTSQRQKNVTVNSNGNALLSYVTNNSGGDAKIHKLLRDLRTAPICGWYVDPDIVYRKKDCDGLSKSKGTTGAAGKDNTIPRDLRNKSYSSEDFRFKHYADTGLYIEQYRDEHTCCDTSSLPITRNNLSDPRNINSCSHYFPPTFCSQFCLQQNINVPSLQEKSFIQNTEQQYQAPHKPHQVPTVLYTDKQEQQRRSSKKSYSPSESTHARANYQRAGITKETLFTPAINDISLHKVEATVMKLPTSNLNFIPIPTKHIKLPSPGSPLDLDTGGESVSPKLPNGSGRQARARDTSFGSAGNRTEKQNSGVKEIVTKSEVQLESPCLIRKCDPESKPSQLPVTYNHRENVNKTGQILQAQPFSNNRNVVPNSSNKENNLPNSDPKKASKSTIGGETISEPKLPGKEKSMLTVTGHDYLKSRKSLMNHSTVPKEQDGNLMLSHNRRIRHLIEQSKLKCKFDQVFTLSKTPPSRCLLQLSCIHITDPFVEAVPRNRNCNQNCEEWEDVHHGCCSCFTDFKITNRLNSLQKEVPISSGEASAGSVLNRAGELYYFTTDGGYSTANVGGFSIANVERDQCCYRSNTDEAGLINQSFCRHSKQFSNDPNTENGQDSNKSVRDTSWENALDDCLPRKGNHVQTSANKAFIHKLTKEVSTIVKTTVPKFRYSKFPLVCRSQSLDF